MVGAPGRIVQIPHSVLRPKDLEIGMRWTFAPSTRVESSSDSGLPFAFNKRDNTKSLEELSLSSNATNVAVAETVLRQEMCSKDGELGYIKPVDPESLIGKGSVNPNPPVNLASPEKGEQHDVTVLMLAKVVVQMDGRLREMERTLAEVMKKQDAVLKAVQERGC